MAMYNMNQEVKRIAELQNRTEEAVAEELGLKKVSYSDGCYWIAWNRREERAVIAALEEAEDAKIRAEIRAERLATFHWIKEKGDWVVAGDFEGKIVGDTIVVMKANGSKQEKRISAFTESGNAYVK
ncbi:MAG: hypothetical protein GX236_00015 [Clostridiaceae bacterium]|nr:hypothetical protein [Clostridiaceae bacterium]